MFIKFFTTKAFDRAAFIDLLNRHDVACGVCPEGVVLDLDKFNKVKDSEKWFSILSKDVNNPLKTRTANLEEWPLRHTSRYVLFIQSKETWAALMQDSDKDYITKQAQACRYMGIKVKVIDTQEQKEI